MKRASLLFALLMAANTYAALPTTSLFANWRADSGITITGSGVSQWNDLSGNGYHLVQADDGDRPGTGNDGVADYVSFNSQHMDISNSPQVDMRNTSIFVAMRTRSNGTASLVQFGAAEFILYIQSGGQYRHGAATTVYRGNAPEVVGYVSNASNRLMYCGPYSHSASASSAGTTTAGGYIGLWNGNLFELGSTDIYEIAVYSSALDETARNAVFDYFEGTYNCLTRTEPTMFIFEGDSITQTPTYNESYPMQFSYLCDSHPKWINVSQGGDTIQAMSSNTTAVTDWYTQNSSYTNKIAVIWAGTNDIAQDDTATNIQGYMTTWIGAAQTAGYTVVQLTILKRSDNNAAKETVRQDVNSWILSSSPADYVVDMASVTELSDPTNTTYFYDGIHPTAAGSAIIAGEFFEAMESLGYVSAASTSIPVFLHNYNLRRQ